MTKGKEVPSWDVLMQQIALEKGADYKSIKSLLPTKKYSALVLELGEEAIRDTVIEKTTKEGMVDKDRLVSFNDILKTLDCPVLTTNIDSYLDGGQKKSLGQFYQHCSNPHQSIETLFEYWSIEELEEADSGYGVWHINGHNAMKDTIRFGLVDYGKLCARVFDLTNGWSLRKKTHTWLDPFLNNQLCIIGLNLDDAEFFIRWLLLRKAHILKKEGKCSAPDASGWYCYVPKKKCSKDWASQNKILQFLRVVYIEPIPFKDYNSIYLSLFDIK